MKNNRKIYLLVVFLTIMVNLISWGFPFFWDTILTSTITQHFYEHGFHHVIPPPQYDAGHPPLFYVYVTGFYHIFGKGLASAHLAMLPFTMIGSFSFLQLLQYFQFNKKQQIAGILLFFSIPAVITQYTLVSYDAVLLSLYLAALVSMLKNRKILFACILVGIAGISIRGLFCIAALSVTQFFLSGKNIKEWIRWNLCAVPSVLLVFLWYYYHYTQTGWWIATNAGTWSGQRGWADAHGLYKNGLSIARCFFDVGIVWLSIFSLFYLVFKRQLNTFFILFLIPAIIFTIAFVPFSNPINHRYYLIVYALMLIPVIQMLENKSFFLILGIMVLLISGHYQIYPAPVSNAWDCTLEYTSYNYVRDDFFGLYSRDKYIDRTKIGTVFPMDASRKQTDLLSDTVRLINVHGKSIDSIPYVIYTNVGNDFSDEQIEQLAHWQKVVSFKNGKVEMIIYMNPAFVRNN